jgi:hypothetical protein
VWRGAVYVSLWKQKLLLRSAEAVYVNAAARRINYKECGGRGSENMAGSREYYKECGGAVL